MDKFNEKEPIIINSMEEFERLLPEIPPYSTLIIKDSIISSESPSNHSLIITEIILKIDNQKIPYKLRYKLHNHNCCYKNIGK